MASTARLLELLSLLQSGAAIPGPVLAERLGVTERTIRRDVERLRELGYAIDARRGADGSYSLGFGGSAVPPLILDRDETLALAVCVRTAAGESIAGVSDAAERALTKLQQTLPPRARAEADALAAATLRLPNMPTDEVVDPDVLIAVSAACREQERLAAEYRDGVGNVTERRIEPYRVVSVERRWYLVAYDLDRRAWRTFRLDRFISVRRTGHGVRLVDPPDAVEYVRRSLSTAPYRHEVKVRVHAPIAEVAMHVGPRFAVLEELDAATTLLTAGVDDYDYISVRLGVLPFDFEVLEPADLRAHMAQAAARMMRGCGCATDAVPE
jgi:predicted DNA-binding transcriptional regulator YafY